MIYTQLRSPILCTLILIYILYTYIKEKHLDLRNTKVFRDLLICATINLFFDIITELPNYGVNIPDIPHIILQTISLISLYLSCYFIHKYMLVFIERNKSQKHKSSIKINQIVAILTILLIIIAPLYISISNGIMYLDGPKIYVVYFGVSYLIFSEIYHLIKDKKYIPQKQHGAITMSVIIFIITAFIQIAFPYIMISGIGLTLEVFILYLSLEKPEKYININTETFNATAFECVIKEKIFLQENNVSSKKEKIFLYDLGIQHSQDTKEFFADYIKSLSKMINAPIYLISERIIVIINQNNVFGYILHSVFQKTIEITTLENIKEQMEDFIKTSNNEFYIDKMTNTFNRNKYELDIKNKFDKQNLWYIIADINNLKQTNDILGHDKGDELIKDFAKLLSIIFGNELIYRIGGDEFVIISKEDASKRIEKLKEKVLEINAIENKNITFAIGSEYKDSKEDIEDVIKRADANMYKNKKEVKERIKF